MRTRDFFSPSVRRVLFLLGFLLAVGAAVAVGWPDPVTARDQEQGRLNVVVPPPRAESEVAQTFCPRRDGLTAIELLLARRGEPAGESETLTLSLTTDQGSVVAETTLVTRYYAHNDPFRWTFPRQPASGSTCYRLTFSGSAENQLSVWGYDTDVMADGSLTGADREGDAPAAELRFSTDYALSGSQAARLFLERLPALFPLLLIFLAVAPLPGALLLLAWRGGSRWDPAAWAGAALALGLSVWPLLWLWPPLLGWRWERWSLTALAGIGWLGAFLLLLRRRPSFRLHIEHGVLLLILLVGWWARVVAVRDLAFPAWVDASRHGLITAVMEIQGGFPTDYRPLLTVEETPYHYGFHALATTLHLLSGAKLNRLLLDLGQLLNALVPLAAYAGAWLLTRRRDVGVVAALLTALPYFFPAYYATWGRFTQLTGMLLLPLGLAFTWRLVRGARGPRTWVLLAVVAAGLFLVHARAFVFFLPFPALVWLFSGGRQGRRLLLAAGSGLLLVLPRMLVLLGENSAGGLALTPAAAGYNDFPVSYVTTGWEPWFWGAGGVALLGALVGAWRRRPWALPLVALGLWSGLLFLLLSGRRLGLPELWVINLNSFVISLFLPLSWVTAVAGVHLYRWLERRHWIGRAVLPVLVGMGAALLILFGWRQQAGILNPATVLARPADEAGLAWMAEHVPDDATVAVNSWRWLGGTWAGSDGGAWGVVLTGRSTTTPPADYIYDPLLAQQVDDFNQAASAVEDWSTPAAADFLHRENVDYVFVGQRGGFFDPAALRRNPALTTRYAHDGVFIFGFASD